MVGPRLPARHHDGRESDAKKERKKERKCGPTCRDLGHAFLPLGFTARGAMTEGTKKLLEMVPNAADGQGYVGGGYVGCLT